MINKYCSANTEILYEAHVNDRNHSHHQIPFIVTHWVQRSLHYTAPVYHWREVHLDVTLRTVAENLEHLHTAYHVFVMCTVNILSS